MSVCEREGKRGTYTDIQREGGLDSDKRVRERQKRETNSRVRKKGETEREPERK